MLSQFQNCKNSEKLKKKQNNCELHFLRHFVLLSHFIYCHCIQCMQANKLHQQSMQHSWPANLFLSHPTNHNKLFSITQMLHLKTNYLVVNDDKYFGSFFYKSSKIILYYDFGSPNSYRKCLNCTGNVFKSSI